MDKLTAYLNRRIDAVINPGILESVVLEDIIVTEDVFQHLNEDPSLHKLRVLGKPISGKKHYSYRIDKQLGEGGPGRQRHIHIFYDGNELFAMNADSTVHDGYHKVRIPNELVSFLESKGFRVPEDKILKCLKWSNDYRLQPVDLNYSALVVPEPEIIRALSDVAKVSIVEANIDTRQVKQSLQIKGKYVHVNKLRDIPQQYLSQIKPVLVEMLNRSGKYCDENILLIEGNNNPRRLFVAWS